MHLKVLFILIVFYFFSQTNIIKPDNRSVKEQNNLNSRNGGAYHQNLYQHLDKLSNPLIAKKLETTEL